MCENESTDWKTLKMLMFMNLSITIDMLAPTHRGSWVGLITKPHPSIRPSSPHRDTTYIHPTSPLHSVYCKYSVTFTVGFFHSAQCTIQFVQLHNSDGGWLSRSCQQRRTNVDHSCITTEFHGYEDQINTDTKLKPMCSGEEDGEELWRYDCIVRVLRVTLKC